MNADDSEKSFILTEKRVINSPPYELISSTTCQLKDKFLKPSAENFNTSPSCRKVFDSNGQIKLMNTQNSNFYCELLIHDKQKCSIASQ